MAKNFPLAKKAFIRIRDLKFIDLAEKAEQMFKMRQLNDHKLSGDIMAY